MSAALQTSREPIWLSRPIALAPFRGEPGSPQPISAIIRADLERQGRPIGPYDYQIAGHARSRGLTVVTRNTGEFERVAGLRVEDWSDRAKGFHE